MHIRYGEDKGSASLLHTTAAAALSVSVVEMELICRTGCMISFDLFLVKIQLCVPPRNIVSIAKCPHIDAIIDRSGLTSHTRTLCLPNHSLITTDLAICG